MPHDKIANSAAHDVLARKLAGIAFILAGMTAIAAIGFSLEGSVYESLAFMYTHAATFLATIFTAVGVTALVYAVGIRRIGLVGIIGSAFTWLSVSVGLFWLMISWGAVAMVTDAQNPPESIAPTLAPAGTGMLAVTGLLVMCGLAAIAVGLLRAGIVHRILAGAGVLLGGVFGAAIFVSLTLANVAILEVLVAISVLTWLWAILLGITLFRGVQLSARDAETTA